MEIVKISQVKSNPKNPRIIKDDKFKKLVKSIQEFPDMLNKRPLVVFTDTDGKFIVLGGNMRLKACKEIGLKEIPIIVADEWTEEQKHEFIVKDNVGFGEWDWDMLANEWDTEKLQDWGLDLPVFEVDEVIETEEKTKKLSDRFIIPPFSVLDTRQAIWQNRKSFWNEILNDNGETREEEDFSIRRNTGIQKRNNEIATDKQKQFQYNDKNISLFDPVVAELFFSWFCKEKGFVIDCFSGDTRKGNVFTYLGGSFTGIELRESQVNYNNLKSINNAKWICDNGVNIKNYIFEKTADMLISCPPYFDLEVYSELKEDASNQNEYIDFIKILRDAYSNSIDCLKEDTFACIVIQNIRKIKAGLYIDYYPFKEDIIDIFKNKGMIFYNDIVLLKANGTAAMRAKPYMAQRKLVPIHEYILVFYKGNPKNIKANYPELDLSYINDIETEE